jgi:hypothetical protein
MFSGLIMLIQIKNVELDSAMLLSGKRTWKNRELAEATRLLKDYKCGAAIFFYLLRGFFVFLSILTPQIG